PGNAYLILVLGRRTVNSADPPRVVCPALRFRFRSPSRFLSLSVSQGQLLRPREDDLAPDMWKPVSREGKSDGRHRADRDHHVDVYRHPGLHGAVGADGGPVSAG